jgi:L-lactate dehydrogenase complex protein LldE
MVEVLRRVGCQIVFDERQTCCGQPAFNSGYRHEARIFAKRFIEIFEETDADAIVAPSGSCTAMVKHFHELFPDEEMWHRRAETIAAKTNELSGFLVNVLKKTDVDASGSGRFTWHDACHGLRELGLREEPRLLLKNVKGLEFVEMANADVCCGFGGTFSVKYPEISAGILDNKIEAIENASVDTVVSGDASCLMQIGGRLSRLGSKVNTMHLAEVLAMQK